MLSSLRSGFFRAAVLGLLVLLSVATLGSGLVAAQVRESDVASDSEFELLEQAESGAYQNYSIKFTSRNGRAVLMTDRDGVKGQFEVTSTEYLTLWQDALKNGLETLVDASEKDPVPDQSHFAIRYRVWQTTRQFSVSGVDTLSDGRYRAVVRALLALADKYVRLGGR
jgi:hypothetical protein